VEKTAKMLGEVIIFFATCILVRHIVRDGVVLVSAAASVARHLYIRSPCGVKGLVKIYGGRQNNGTCPSHFCGGSSSVARKALQALEHLKIVEKDATGYDAAGTRLTGVVVLCLGLMVCCSVVVS